MLLIGQPFKVKASADRPAPQGEGQRPATGQRLKVKASALLIGQPFKVKASADRPAPQGEGQRLATGQRLKVKASALLQASASR